MPARVTALISLRSRTPARMSARISPAVTRSQRQTIIVVVEALDELLHGSRDPRLLHPDAGDALGDLARRPHLHQQGAVVGLGRADARHLDVAQHRAVGVEHRDDVALP